MVKFKIIIFCIIELNFPYVYLLLRATYIIDEWVSATFCYRSLSEIWVMRNIPFSTFINFQFSHSNFLIFKAQTFKWAWKILNLRLCTGLYNWATLQLAQSLKFSILSVVLFYRFFYLTVLNLHSIFRETKCCKNHASPNNKTMRPQIAILKAKT